MTYTPPKDIWEVSNQLRFDEPLEAGDPRYVDTGVARGDFTYQKLLRSFGVDHRTNELRASRRRHFALFCGHRGSGKSTELRQLAARLHRPEAFEVLLLDVVRALDTNNLQYADVHFALAEALVERLTEKALELEPIHYSRLTSWFEERIEKHEKTKELAAELKAGAKVESGLPFVGKLFAGLTTALRTNSTYKEELRRVLKNSFADFAAAFQGLVDAAEAAIAAVGGAKRLLFVVDGTDRLSEEDSRRFFVGDVHQLQLVEGQFIYCAPIHLIYEANINQAFDHVFKLPMIKLHEKGSRSMLADAYLTMRELVYQRADPSLFDSLETLDYLIQHSGGHPRDLLRLVDYAFENAEQDIFDKSAAQVAVRQLATDYRRLLRADDYALLKQIDEADKHKAPATQRVLDLLFNLVLLEYNDYWWQTHPAVRTLEAYKSSTTIDAGA